MSEAAGLVGRDRRAIHDDIAAEKLPAERHRKGRNAMYRILLRDLTALYGALSEESDDGEEKG